METSTSQISDSRIVKYKSSNKKSRCLSCGTDQIKPGRRYCSKECRGHMNWVLSLSKGLLRTFNARYAAFSFTKNHVILDLLPVWSKEVSRFIQDRTPGNRPSEDLKRLVLESGSQWYRIVNNRNSKSYASLLLLQKNNNKNVDPESIKPNRTERLRFSKFEIDCLKILKLEREDLETQGSTSRIKSAYKKMAKVHHPDLGGDAEKFKALNEAHKQMLIWTENPQYTYRKALYNCWSYDGATNRWSPPL